MAVKTLVVQMAGRQAFSDRQSPDRDEGLGSRSEADRFRVERGHRAFADWALALDITQEARATLLSGRSVRGQHA